MKALKKFRIYFMMCILGMLIINSCEKTEEDEVIPEFGLLITETNDSTIVIEDGNTDTYTIALKSQPEANVTITISPDLQTTVSKSEIIFTPNDWYVAKVITVEAVNDTIPENYHTGDISHVSASTDESYNGINFNFTVDIIDNEFHLIISGSRTGHYCIVDPVTGNDLAEPAPAVHYVGQLTMGYMSHKALIVSPIGPGGGTPVIYSCDAMTGENVFQIVSENDWHVLDIDGSPVKPKIAFAAKDIINWHLNIHTINEDGTGYFQLTSYEEGIECPTKVSAKIIGADIPAWSPDGSKIACKGYIREIITNYAHNSIIIMYSDGGNKIVLYDEPVEETWYRDICWTKDGQFLIFSVAEGSIRAVKALHIGTKTVTDIHSQMEVGGLGVQNHWTSPIENKIVYMLISPGGSDLYIINFQTSGSNFTITGGPTKLTDELAVGHGYQQPVWAHWDGN